MSVLIKAPTAKRMAPVTTKNTVRILGTAPYGEVPVSLPETYRVCLTDPVSLFGGSLTYSTGPRRLR
jgi:hypothetical protein